MINTETDKVIIHDEFDGQANIYFEEFAKENQNSINEDEFYQFLEKFLNKNKKGEMLKELKEEKLFSIYVEKGVIKMSLEEFTNAYKEALLLLEETHEGLDVDLNFDEADLRF